MRKNPWHAPFTPTPDASTEDLLEMSEDLRKADCPRCQRLTSCDVRGSYGSDWLHEDEDNFVNGRNDYFILQCRGCELVFFEKTGWCSEDVKYEQNRRSGTWEETPVERRTIFSTLAPEKGDAAQIPLHKLDEIVTPLHKVDSQLSRIMYETYQAQQQGALILAAVGLRTAFDRATEVLKIHPGYSLEDKVKRLLGEGFVGETEARVLKVVVDAGNAAAHRSWNPSAGQFGDLLIALEHFLQRVLLNDGHGALDIAADLPPRHDRPPRQG
jgi:hypothetical protein